MRAQPKIKSVCRFCGRKTTPQTIRSHEKFCVLNPINERFCLHCGKKVISKTSNFCNRSCAGIYSNSKKPNKIKGKYFCKNCGKEISYPKFCSYECYEIFRYNDFIKKWLSGEISGTVKNGTSGMVKRYMIEKHRNKCSKCGWEEINQFTGKVPIDLHHIDGNKFNSKEGNLELLCPNCHSLTPNYKFNLREK